MKLNIPITKTIFGDEEKEAIVKPLETGWVVQGPNVAKFQTMFADFTGSKYAHASSNCTTALHLGLEAMGITKGDKVIVPSFTYVASANAVEYTGAEVVFCDIDLKTFNIDETKLEEMIKKDSSIKGIMPVNLFGLCANMPYIMELAKKYNLKVIEDSACGFDGWIGDKHSGTFGDCGCFSFHPRKSICTGEGGMLITDDENIASKVSQLKDHGASKSDLQRHKEKGGSLLPDFTMRGYNYRMTDMQGALGVCQMNKKDYIMNGRREVANKYDIALKEIAQLITPYIPENYRHGYQSYVCIFTDGEDISNLTKEQIDRINIKRNIFMEKLEEMTIATRQGTHAVHTLGYYKNKNNFKDEDFLMSYAADRLSIALPLYAGMTNEEFDYVISNIKEALK
ncbi:DegT/DnrJ/EryC1/StrS aminotransferase [Aliarcobacter butzleri RM4018]|uniref:DegT/DnrJ/EryC1/StrS aminotransferase n=1 Tax=Aliarcobacter butzleri (strain RM4018) TaxID=367737 RepID=A8ESK8_ALIB4|nr:DegT/DnrJ/EryC1/StrS family aminotransferase [Aliarcobacter butzleri]ABV66932.1 DegT/DnrJ/EryC1/StrS aminotransferase [Aliarcobacter butzleri RM4018]GGT80819.1 perosamine synthetase [Aliarcobacter butzleri]SNV26094.1 UDP-4-amino-4-deoxy-L-arabinose--oxoglutarate aminotransferase [Aliarcobacter butzleri]